MSEPRACKECGDVFRPRQDSHHGQRVSYCSIKCARIRQGKDRLLSLDQDIARFWSRVDKTPGLGPKGECWEWRGQLSTHGYGQAPFQGRRVAAHRLAYELVKGPLPDGLCACHSCDNPPCCNPECLFPGSVAQNNADMAAKGRSNRGEKNPHAKLTAASVIAIRQDTRKGREIARAFSISPSIVSQIKNRQIWRSIA